MQAVYFAAALVAVAVISSIATAFVIRRLYRSILETAERKGFRRGLDAFTELKNSPGLIEHPRNPAFGTKSTPNSIIGGKREYHLG